MKNRKPNPPPVTEYKKSERKAALPAVPCSTHRDLSIDAALHVLCRTIDPLISNAEIQRRAETDVHAEGYMVKLDGKPVAAIELDGSKRFSMTILS